MVQFNCCQGDETTDLILGLVFRKGGSIRGKKLNTALSWLSKAAAVLSVVAEAGKKVLALCEG